MRLLHVSLLTLAIVIVSLLLSNGKIVNAQRLDTGKSEKKEVVRPQYKDTAQEHINPGTIKTEVYFIEYKADELVCDGLQKQAAILKVKRVLGTGSSLIAVPQRDEVIACSMKNPERHLEKLKNDDFSVVFISQKLCSGASEIYYELRMVE